MARIAGIDLPREKRVEIGLTYIFGIAPPDRHQTNLGRHRTWRDPGYPGSKSDRDVGAPKIPWNVHRTTT